MTVDDLREHSDCRGGRKLTRITNDKWQLEMVCSQTQLCQDVLMTILDNYMFRPLLVIFRLSSRELKVLLYTLCAHVMNRALHPGFVA